MGFFLFLKFFKLGEILKDRKVQGKNIIIIHDQPSRESRINCYYRSINVLAVFFLRNITFVLWLPWSLYYWILYFYSVLPSLSRYFFPPEGFIDAIFLSLVMFEDVFLLFLYLNDIFIISTILEFHFLSLRTLRYCSSGIEYC